MDVNGTFIRTWKVNVAKGVARSSLSSLEYPQYKFEARLGPYLPEFMKLSACFCT